MITIPWKGERPTVDPTPQPTKEHGILVVDSNKGKREEVNAWLRNQGYGVWVGSTGLEAIDLYTLHRDAISVVLISENMDAGDGPSTLAALRQINPQVCCCFMTDDRTGYTEAQLLDLGAKEVVQTPCPLKDIKQLLWKLAAPVQSQTAVQNNLWRDEGGQG